MTRGTLMASTLAGAYLFASGAIAQAGNSDPAAQPKKHSAVAVETVIVTGEHEKLDKIPLKAAFTQSTISKEIIRNASPGVTTTVQTLLNQEPSITAVTSGPSGMRTDIKFRAFNDGQFGETFDGVPLNDAFNAGATNQASNRNNVLLTLNSIDGVDIYRGINNPSVNTYNSLGGTINFQPRQPGENFSANVGATYGSFNTFGWHGTVNTGDIGGLRQIVSFDHTDSKGWLQNAPDHNNNLYYGAQDNFDGGNSQLYAYFIYNTNQGYSPHTAPVALIAQYGRSYQWPKSWAYSFNDDTNFLTVVGYKTKVSDVVSYDGKFYGGMNDYKRTSYSNPAERQSGTQPYYLPNQSTGYAWWIPGNGYPIPMNYDPAAQFGSVHDGTDYHFYGYQSTTIGYKGTVTVDLPHNMIATGGDISSSYLHSREYWYGAAKMPMTVGYNDAWDESDDRLLASAYVQDDIHFWDDRVHITPGVKYIYAHTTDSDSLGFYYTAPGTVSADEHFVSPTVGASVEFLPGAAAYASFGQNVKFPDISAFYNAFQQDANGSYVTVPVTVKPEYVNDYEVGLRYKRGGFLESINFYQENFENTFVTSTDPSSGLTKTGNAGASRYRGVELQLNDDFGHIVLGDWNGYLNYAHNEAEYTATANLADTGLGGTVTKGQNLTDVPHDLVTAGLVWNWDNWRVNADGQYVGTRYMAYGFAGTPAAAPDPTTLPSYFLVNLGIVKVVPVDFAGANAVKFSLNIDNLLDRHYYARGYVDFDNNGASYTRALEGAGRAIYGGVSFYF